MDTPKPQAGTWTLIAPNGREWKAESPLHCVRDEQRERVTPEVALARILAAADEPDFAERHLPLALFYSAKNTDELIDKMETHIQRLAKVAELGRPFSFAPQRTREG